jgi:STE24 endopeptidase
MNWKDLADGVISRFSPTGKVLVHEPVVWYKNQLVAVAVAFCTAIYLFQQFVNLRQHRRLLEKSIPSRIKAIVKPDEFEKSRIYSLDKSSFAFVVQFFGYLDVLYLMYQVYPKIWGVSGRLAAQYLSGATEVRQSLVFLGIMTVIGKVVSLPFELYSTFVIEKRHGFNKQTLGLFFTDLVKGLLLTAVFGGASVAALVYIVRRFGDRFFLALWLFSVAFQLFILLIFPTVIQPLFNKFDPLPEGTLKSKIEALARRLSFPLGKIFVMDGSKRSSHSNAYFFGFFSKRIVLFDTLISQNTEDEICAVLGHELGHWKHWHTLQMLAVSNIHLLAIFFGFSRIYGDQRVYDAFGFTGEQPVVIGMMLFMLFLSPAEVIMAFLINMLSRHNEFQADRFAVKLGYGELLQSALIKLQVENKGNMNPDWMYSTMHYSHPPLVQRLDAIKDAMKKAK